jgi:hypothetical protein
MIGVVRPEDRDLDECKINKALFVNSNPYEKSLRDYDQARKNRNLEQSLISEVRDEVARAGGFKLVFPSYNVPLYRNFIATDRQSNAILRNEIMRNLGK